MNFPKILSLILLAISFPSFSGGDLSEDLPEPQSFSNISSNTNNSKHQKSIIQRQERTDRYKKALEELKMNPAIANLPTCMQHIDGDCIFDRNQLSIHEDVSATAKKPHHEEPTPTDNKFALLIGNSQYLSKKIPELLTPKHDVIEIENILLTKFGYKTKVIFDASKSEIINQLNELAITSSPSDTILIFYAGHGYQVDDTKMGFWIPVDASADSASGWISNSDVTTILKSTKGSQIILISDSCYSGTLANEFKLSESSFDPSSKNKGRAVIAFTSGAEEPVSDEGLNNHSIFAFSLIEKLFHSPETIRGYYIWSEVSEFVMKNYPQNPQYGAILTAHHTQGSDFVFKANK